MILEKLNRRFANGGVDEQQGSNNLFAATNFKAFAPTIAAGLDLTQYSKDVKESEANRLAAFNDMKAAESLSYDQNKAREMSAEYQKRFDEAHDTLKNPFDLTRFAQKQAIDYVNNPLRKNIEESANNRKISQELAAKTPDVDATADMGTTLMREYEYNKRGGATTDKNSVYAVKPPTKTIDPNELAAQANSYTRELDSNLKGTYGSTKINGEDFYVINHGGKSQNLRKANAASLLAVQNNPKVISNTEGTAFNEEYQKAISNGKTHIDAMEDANLNYKANAIKKQDAIAQEMAKALYIERDDNQIHVGQVSHPTAKSGKGGEAPRTESSSGVRRDKNFQDESEGSIEQKTNKEIRISTLGRKFDEGVKAAGNDDLVGEGDMEELIKFANSNPTPSGLKDLASTGFFGEVGASLNPLNNKQETLNAYNKNKRILQSQFAILNSYLPVPFDTKEPTNPQNIPKLKKALSNYNATLLSDEDIQIPTSKGMISKATAAYTGNDKQDLYGKQHIGGTENEFSGILRPIVNKDGDIIIAGGFNQKDKEGKEYGRNHFAMQNEFQPETNPYLREFNDILKDVRTNGVNKQNSKYVGYDRSGDLGWKSIENGQVKYIPIKDALKVIMDASYMYKYETSAAFTPYLKKAESIGFEIENIPQ
jgi:hypothetical protein